METRLSLTPGQNGTKKLVARYGDRLICVRYRYDAARGVRHKTVELIVESVPWSPRARSARRAPGDMVGIHISYVETEVRERVKKAGAIWRARQQLWELDWRTVRELGLQGRVVDDGQASAHIHLDIRAHIQISTAADLSIAAYRISLSGMLSIAS